MRSLEDIIRRNSSEVKFLSFNRKKQQVWTFAKKTVLVSESMVGNAKRLKILMIQSVQLVESNGR